MGRSGRWCEVGATIPISRLEARLGRRPQLLAKQPRIGGERERRNPARTWLSGEGALDTVYSVVMLILLALVTIVVPAIFMYNSLVKLRNAVDNGWAQIDVQLTRRAELIPNLVETVKGYASHERETLESVIGARNAGLGAETVADKAGADNLLTGALGKLFALSESYPQLKADANFRQLQEELTATENKVSFARQFYNDTVTRLNTKIQTFPWMLVASLGSFKPRELFEAADGHRGSVKVEF
jgi:LemA protein